MIDSQTFGPQTAAYYTLGCKLNFSESSTFAREFESAGYERVDEDSIADLYVINTCSVTEHADKKCRQTIRKLHKKNPKAVVVVTGCYAQLQPCSIAEIEGVDAVIGAGNKGELFKIADAILEKRKAPLLYPCDISEVENIFPAFSQGDRTRSFLKIQDGKALNDVEGIARYRISSIEPNLLREDILGFISSGTKFQPHFHNPLQSGSNSILAKIRRRYNREMFADKISMIRELMGDVFFGIDVIAGFPGEGEEEFAETYVFLADQIKPAAIHVFPYSRRANTDAAAMKGQVREIVKTQRVEKLMQLSDKLHDEYCCRFKGTEQEVLFESANKDGKMFGYTGNYIKVERPYNEEFIGEIAKVRL